MDEQRYVVEITRPVPPEKVGQVAQRIAERLNVPVDRIVTLLDGRLGEVTKPVLADKADAIAEVFAEAGVRVVVTGARNDPPRYEEEFGAPAVREGEAEGPGPAPEYDYEYDHEDDHGDDFGDEVEDEVEVAVEDDDDVPWGQDATWGFDSTKAQEWRRPDSEPGAGEPEVEEPPEDAPEEDVSEEDVSELDAPAGAGSMAGEYVPEEEADRLGPRPRPLRVEVEPPGVTPGREPQPAEPAGPHDAGDGAGRAAAGGEPTGGYSASTRWTPSPHDPYAFSPQDAPGFAGRRPTPMGPARTSPLAPAEGERQEERPGAATRDSIGGFFSPEEEPREGPHLRVYLLWALAISLLVLILLQFVLALRFDGADTAALGAYEAGLAAYRRGDFAAARNLWEPVADAGHAQAQYFLGFMLQNGLGQPWSNARAANWYRRAAHQGLPAAQLALGDLYLRGLGVELDPRVGAAWYASAAVAGDPAGQFEYARLLMHGVGVEKDMAAALAWFEAAAAGGHEAATDYVEYARANAAPLQATH